MNCEYLKVCPTRTFSGRSQSLTKIFFLAKCVNFSLLWRWHRFPKFSSTSFSYFSWSQNIPKDFNQNILKDFYIFWKDFLHKHTHQLSQTYKDWIYMYRNAVIIYEWKWISFVPVHVCANYIYPLYVYV